MCRMVRRRRILVVLVRGGAQVGRSEHIHHQRPELIDERDIANTYGRARPPVVALEVVERRGAATVGAAGLKRTAGRPRWTGDAPGRVALLGWLDDGVAAHLRPGRCSEHRHGGDGEQSNELTESHDNDLLLSWKRTLTRLPPRRLLPGRSGGGGARAACVMPRRAGRPRPRRRHTRTLPCWLPSFSTSCLEDGVDATEGAAAREEVNAPNRETCRCHHATTSRVRPTSCDRGAALPRGYAAHFTSRTMEAGTIADRTTAHALHAQRDGSRCIRVAIRHGGYTDWRQRDGHLHAALERHITRCLDASARTHDVQGSKQP